MSSHNDHDSGHHDSGHHPHDSGHHDSSHHRKDSGHHDSGHHSHAQDDFSDQSHHYRGPSGPSGGFDPSGFVRAFGFASSGYDGPGDDSPRGGRRRGGWSGRDWDSDRGWGPERGGPPPWLAAMFGSGHDPRGSRGPRGQRARRGDVRAAILDVLATEPLNGYQIIQQIAERSDGMWKPSPGSVYPTMQQLEDEGLIEPDPTAKGKVMRLSEAGQDYVSENPEELAAVWRPFTRQRNEEQFAALKPEIGKLMGAAWQILANGTDEQRRAAGALLVETRRKLYSILAEEDDERPSS